MENTELEGKTNEEIEKMLKEMEERSISRVKQLEEDFKSDIKKVSIWVKENNPEKK